MSGSLVAASSALQSQSKFEVRLPSASRIGSGSWLWLTKNRAVLTSSPQSNTATTPPKPPTKPLPPSLPSSTSTKPLAASPSAPTVSYNPPSLLVFIHPRIDTLSFYAHEQFSLFLDQKKQQPLHSIDLTNLPICPDADVFSFDEICSQLANVIVHSTSSGPAQMGRYAVLEALECVTLRHRCLEWVCGDDVQMAALFGAWRGVWSSFVGGGGVEMPRLVLQAQESECVNGKWGFKSEFQEYKQPVRVAFVEETEEEVKEGGFEEESDYVSDEDSEENSEEGAEV